MLVLRCEGAVTIKQATTPVDIERLEAEARVLRAACHPGVVRLISLDTDADGNPSLATRTCDGAPLGDCGPLPPEEIYGLGAAVATTLADLHDLGIVHGAIQPDHILLGTDGRPVLCGFGRATLGVTGRAEDVAALAGVIKERLGIAGVRGLPRALRAATDLRCRRRPTARALASALTQPELGARLPSPGVIARPVSTPAPVPVWVSAPDPVPTSDPVPLAVPTSDPVPTSDQVREAFPRPSIGPPDRRVGRRRQDGEGSRSSVVRSGRRLIGSLASVGVLVAVMLIVVSHSRAHGAVGRPASPCPAVDAGCSAVPLAGGVLNTAAGRFEIAEPGDIVVLGRWTCRLPALPALLRPTSGQVWVFDRWATDGTDVAGRQVGQITGGRGLTVLPAPSGCDRLGVVTAPGRLVQVIDPVGVP